MEMIYQRFNLNLEALAELEDGKKPDVLSVQSGRTLKRRMLEKGYVYLESNEIFCGVNKSVILGGSFKQNHKADFYEVAEELNLHYRSGEYYTQTQ